MHLSIIFVTVAVMLITKLCLPLAKRIGLVDHPGGRKQHIAPTPLVGGIAMFLAFVMGVWVLGNGLEPERAFLAASFLVLLTGTLDDFHELTPRFRLFVQFVAAVIMVIWGKVSLLMLGNLFGGHIIIVPSFIGFILSILAVIGLTNAINMLDGVDGLLGTIVLSETAFLTYIAWSNGFVVETTILSILMASIVGYLWFNFPFPWRQKAIIFMGDAGSMFLGFTLVWFSILLSQAPGAKVHAVVFLWIMSIPVFDIGSVVLRRLLQKRSPFKPDREHGHHLLQSMGLKNLTIVCFYATVTIALSFIGLILQKKQIIDGISLLLFVIAFVVYFVGSELLWRRVKKATKKR